jgi:hypothetical protein
MPAKIACLMLMLFLFMKVKAQDEDKFQPDSVYRYCKVKRIYVYGYSPRDLSKVIDLDTNGRKIKLVNYDESYNRKTRAQKRIYGISRYIYDSEKKLIEVIDSDKYMHSSDETDHTYFFYSANGVLTASTHYKYYKGKYVYSHTDYGASPFKSIITRRNDSMIIYQNTQEYDRDFYERRSYGYSWEPKLKTGFFVHGTDTTSYQYSDYKDLKRLESFHENTNQFNSKGQLISSDINQRFMVDPGTWTTFQDIAIYNYYANGLLKWISGYSGKSFKYEFYK